MAFDYTQQPGLKRWDNDYVADAAPLVSVITPYYNGGKHLRQTCNSILNQTFPFFEWIIVDDGSTHSEDVALLEEIRKEDPRIRILHKENGGAASARNVGIRNARSAYVLPVDCDDLLEPTYIEYCWWMLEKHPDAAWAYTDSLGFQAEEYLWTRCFDPQLLKTENHLTNCALIRKSAFDKVGGYCDKYRYFHEDWHFWLKLVAAGEYPVQSQGEPLMWYRRTDTGSRSVVDGDKEYTDINRKLIAEIGGQIHGSKPPVLYPRPFDCHWEKPQLSSWDRSIYRKKDKPHVAFLFPHLEMGGADKFNLDLMQGLVERGYDVGALTTIRCENQWLQRFRACTPHIFNLPNFVQPKDYAEFISYYIISRQVDVLFLSNSYHGYYLLPWLREHFPDLVIVDYVHMEEWYWRVGGYARTSAAVGGVTERTYVCNSATERVLTDHFLRRPESVETVHIGVDHHYFDRSKVAPGKLYQELGIPESRPVVLFICRLHPQKRPFLMLEIARKAADRLPDIAFAVVGDGPQEDALRHRSHVLGLHDNVYFMGARSDVRPYYRDAALTLVCSLKEGLSLTAYESCSMGVPVISADVGGQGDLVDECVGALIPCLQSEEHHLDSREFPKEEVASYVDAIVELLQNKPLYDEKAAACRKRVEEAFSIDCMVEYFDAELQRLMNDSILLEKRREVSKALQLCTPMAAEFFTMEMQEESVETIICNTLTATVTPATPTTPEVVVYRRKTVWDMVKITYHEAGFWAIFRRTYGWIMRRVRQRLHIVR